MATYSYRIVNVFTLVLCGVMVLTVVLTFPAREEKTSTDAPLPSENGV